MPARCHALWRFAVRRQCHITLLFVSGYIIYGCRLPSHATPATAIWLPSRHIVNFTYCYGFAMPRLRICHAAWLLKTCHHGFHRRSCSYAAYHTIVNVMALVVAAGIIAMFTWFVHYCCQEQHGYYAICGLLCHIIFSRHCLRTMPLPWFYWHLARHLRFTIGRCCLYYFRQCRSDMTRHMLYYDIRRDILCHTIRHTCIAFGFSRFTFVIENMVSCRLHTNDLLYNTLLAYYYYYDSHHLLRAILPHAIYYHHTVVYRRYGFT